MENIFLAASLMIFGFGTLAFSKNNETRPAKAVQPSELAVAIPVSGAVKAVVPVKPIAAIRVIARDTLPEEKEVSPVNGHSAISDVMIISNMSEGVSGQNGKETTVAQIGDDVYKITKLNGSVISLNVNGADVTQAKIADYKGTLNKISGQLDKMRAGQEIRNKEQVKRNAEQAVRNKEQEKRNAEQVVRNKEQEKRNAEQAIRNEEQEKRNAEQVIRNKEQEQRNAELRSLMDDLVSANIIKDPNSLKSLSLNDGEMIVNGQKQSSAVHEKFKNKYLKSSTDEINFRNF